MSNSVMVIKQKLKSKQKSVVEIYMNNFVIKKVKI
jgi:hypothetical protein